MLHAAKPLFRASLVVLGLFVTPVLAIPMERWVDDNCSPPTTGSCDDPFCTINEANSASSSTEVDTIWVRPGTYTDPSDGQIKITKRVKVRSTDGPATTTIRAEVLFETTGQGPETLLEGFTVTNPSGTGIRCNGKSPEIRGNVITGCTNSGIIMVNSEALLIDNVISNNSTPLSGGGILVSNSQDTQVLRIVDCNIVGNTANSSGGGIFAEKKGELWLVNTVIRGNKATNVSGGGAYFSGIPFGASGNPDPCSTDNFRVIMQNDLITCNNAFGDDSGEGGGGVYFSSLSEGQLSNCTFSQNSADLWGGALFARDSCVQAYNSVFWDNTASAGGEIANSYANLTLDRNVVEGNCAGVHLNFQYAFSCTNVINDNPDFLDPDGADNTLCTADDDYRLNRDASGGSPAVDSGDNTKVAFDGADLDRDTVTNEPTPLDLFFCDRAQCDLADREFVYRDRFVDDPEILPHGTEIVDMGAYETARCVNNLCPGQPADPCRDHAVCDQQSDWCEIAYVDCNANGKQDYCEIGEGQADCNSNGCPDVDDGEGACIRVPLVSSVYVCNDSLPRMQGNVLRLTFKCDVSPLPSPPSYPVRIQSLSGGGGFGTDLAANFKYTLDPNNTVLRIAEVNSQDVPITIFSNATWYGIRESTTWPKLAPFERDYVTVYGDADNTKLTDFADLSFIFANLTDTALDQDRSDINKDGYVDYADINLAFSFNGSAAPAKPTGHTCLP